MKNLPAAFFFLLLLACTFAIRTDAMIGQSQAYWKEEAKPFAIADYSMDDDGTLHLFINNKYNRSLILSEISLHGMGAEPRISPEKAVLPNETSDITLQTTKIEHGVFEFSVNFTYREIGGTKEEYQRGVKNLVGKTKSAQLEEFASTSISIFLTFVFPYIVLVLAYMKRESLKRAYQVVKGDFTRMFLFGAAMVALICLLAFFGVFNYAPEALTALMLLITIAGILYFIADSAKKMKSAGLSLADSFIGGMLCAYPLGAMLYFLIAFDLLYSQSYYVSLFSAISNFLFISIVLGGIYGGMAVLACKLIGYIPTKGVKK